jgi:hypothetical protein
MIVDVPALPVREAANAAREGEDAEQDTTIIAAILDGTGVDCLVCQDHGKAVLCMTCGHMIACEECANGIAATTGRCPLCRRHCEPATVDQALGALIEANPTPEEAELAQRLRAMHVYP